MLRDWKGAYRELLLVHDIVIHLLAKDPALVKKPRLLRLTDLPTELQGVISLGDPVQERQPSADPIVNLLKDFLGQFLSIILLPIFLQGVQCSSLGKIRHADDFHAGRIPLQALVDPVIVTIHDFFYFFLVSATCKSRISMAGSNTYSW